MAHQATLDNLTGLAHRRAFENGLRDLLEDAQMYGSSHALCHLSVDQSRVINAIRGSAVQDRLANQVAAQLAGQIREHDSIAHLGGDQFGVLLRDTNLERANHTAQRMCTCIEDFRFNCENRPFRLGASAGLVPVTSDSGTAADVLGNAYGACRIARRSGNRVHVLFPRSGQTPRSVTDMERLQHLTNAIDDDDLELVVQVIRAVDWQPGDAVGLECLTRLRGSDGALLKPATFLPLAERYDIMPRIDRWVLGHALDMIAEAAFPTPCVDYFSINLSGQSLTNDDFIDFALSQLQRADVDPARLMFEITETAAVADFGRATRLIAALRDMGCRFALDDFGSGLSSFAYLKNLPLDCIKIDGTFVRDIISDKVDLETVKAINRVARAMGVKTIAEYVENEAILQQLRAIDVAYVQGSHIAPAMPFEQLRTSMYFRHCSKQ